MAYISVIRFRAWSFVSTHVPIHELLQSSSACGAEDKAVPPQHAPQERLTVCPHLSVKCTAFPRAILDTNVQLRMSDVIVYLYI